MPDNKQGAPGSRMSYWIASELKQAREDAGIDEAQMASIAGVKWRTIRRFETGDHMSGNADHFVAQYAYVAGVEDGRDYWEDALGRWRKHGSPPQFEVVPGPAAAFAEAIRVEAMRRRRDAVERSERRRANP